MSLSTVSSADIIKECKARGYLTKQLYVVFTKPTNGIEPVMANLAAHLAFQEQLEKDGVMFAAGPNWNDAEDQWAGDGMVVYRATSLEDATDIAANDPMHVSGARRFTVRPWLVNEGTITIELGFATGRFKLI